MGKIRNPFYFMDEVVRSGYAILLMTSALMSLTGCEHTRRILQMDSNSSSPFLGLQFSVDAGHSKQSADSDEINLVADVRHENSRLPIRHVATDRSKADRRFTRTSTRSPQTADVKFSLPRVDLANDPQTESDVDEIMSRWQTTR